MGQSAWLSGGFCPIAIRHQHIGKAIATRINVNTIIPLIVPPVASP